MSKKKRAVKWTPRGTGGRIDTLAKRTQLMRNRTPSELRLEAELVTRKVKHMPQCPALHYFVDFRILPGKLGVEIDGGYHMTPEQARYDRRRTEQLRGEGWRIIRFTNEEVCSSPAQVVDRIIAEHRR